MNVHAGPPHGFGDDERSRFLRRRPGPQALDWVEAQVGGTVAAVQACKGGSSSSIHVVRLRRNECTVAVVLRRYVLGWLNAEEPDIARREAAVLRLLERCRAPTPRLLGVDPTGADAGTPAILMTRLPGRLDWFPKDMERWLRRLAQVLPVVHETAFGNDEVQPFAPYEPRSWEAPRWMSKPSLWDRAVEVFHGPCLDPERVFIHRDYHPGNVLWRRGVVTGVVDWQAASVGPRSVDVFHCRGNLLGRFGLDVAERFVEVWEDVSGETYHPWSETVMLVDAMTWGAEPARAEQEALESMLARRLSELGL